MTDGVSNYISGETYFFRDHSQIDLLRLNILPELIARRRHAKSLRLWSAGCSTGEEAYSLAMLVDLLLPDRTGWDILILGSDINQQALLKANRGRYGAWSFRLVPPLLQEQYFRRENNEWEIVQSIHRMVTFRAGDLCAPFSDPIFQHMDLILCRNVFVYFDSEKINYIAEKLSASLREGGYLITGHTELIGHRINNLQSRLFTGGVVYQRVAALTEAAKKLPEQPVSVLPAPPVRFASHEPIPTILSSSTDPPETELLMTAQSLADRGEYAQAEQICRELLIVTPLNAELYFLLAQLAQLRGHFEKARELLDKTIYLDPDNVAAHLELAALCERAENMLRAKTLQRAALNIVCKLPGDMEIKPYGTTAADMVQWLSYESDASLR